MISLITGMPGMGKTSLMVSMLLNRSDLKNRPLYVDGIPDLKLPYEEVPENHSMEDWQDWVPTGSILIIDEAQRVFRPRASGAKVPEHVQALETHRHKGVDIFILTQHPRLLDVNVRSLVGEHRHLSNTLLGVKRVSYWARCANPESKIDIAEAKNSVFRTPKEAFGLYKSAEEHTKIKGKKSFWVYIIPIAIIATFFMIMYGIDRYNQRFKWDNAQKQETLQQPAINQPEAHLNNTGTYSNPNNPVAPLNEMASEPMKPQRQPIEADDFKPDIAGQPWTAPVYDSMNRNYKTMPYPVACIKHQSDCTCYTDQATPIRGMDKNICKDFAENGIYNPYVTHVYEESRMQQNQQNQQNQSQSNTQVAELSSNPLPSLSPASSTNLKNIQ